MQGGLANWAAILMVGLFLWIAIDAIISYFRSQRKPRNGKGDKFKGIIGTIIAFIVAKKASDMIQERKNQGNPTQSGYPPNGYPPDMTGQPFDGNGDNRAS